ncbi:hypothetical protein L6164_010964 [Bauhinia variegata]|uniref:Uncharacterized protein n=1 Tax=Bauhinia variegata TaxID=167791 RepID=A0ACB9P888_BAUVA|nr:hypothetical protein L6164_010964 [Bauhinia variegata]
MARTSILDSPKPKRVTGQRRKAAGINRVSSCDSNRRWFFILSFSVGVCVAGRYRVLRRESHKYSSGKEFDHHVTDKNGHLSSFAQNSYSGRSGFYGRKEEREQGEIYSEHDALAPPEKRRKFSPIVWRKQKEVISSKNSIGQVTSLSPTYPSLPGTKEANRVLNGDVSIPKSPTDLSCAMSPEHSSTGNQDVNQFGEDCVQGWNISMSRWACDGCSPKDASDDEFLHDKESSSPESGEFRRESSYRKTTRSSVSSGGSLHSCLSSEDEKGFSAVDSMDSDEEHGETAYHSNQSSESDDSGGLIKVERKINMVQSCRSIFEFEMIKKINEGTYGVVYKARDKKSGEIVALKKVKMNIDRDGFPLSSLREINILLSFDHPSIVDVKEVVVDDFDGVFMVMEYMEYDLKVLMEEMKQPFSVGEVKSLMWKLLKGVKYIHDNWVIHRDLKTSNILLNKDGELKICDFGLSRQYASPLKPYTPVVVTLWYRAPELLLGVKEYSTALDMWSVGCIMAELIVKEPLFKGKTEVEQLAKIFRILGTPDEMMWPGLSKLRGSKANFVKQPYSMLRKKFPATSFTGSPVLSELGFDLLNKLLTYDPEKRITAEDALLHDWFREAPLPKNDFRPAFPSCRG